MRKDIHDADYQTIDKLRRALKPLLAKLGRLQTSAKVATLAVPPIAVNPQPASQENAVTIRGRELGDNAGRDHPANANAPYRRHAGFQEILADVADQTDQDDKQPVRPPVDPRQDDLMYWDNLLDIEETTAAVPPATPEELEEVLPEDVLLALPSNATVAAGHCELELTFRKRKANSLLSQIRELIADKSFKYTDEIRKAPRKGVKTRGQTSVIELNRHLSFLCQVYAWNRARLVDLNADKDTLDLYAVLQKDDVKCSTAMLNPNKAGSTKLKLSWIWQSVDRRIMAGLAVDAEMAATDPATLTECMYLFQTNSIILFIISSSQNTLVTRTGIGRALA